MDRVTAIRSIHHEMIDEHAAAVYWVHVGRPVSGTVQYPSLGSAVSHQLGATDDSAPPYVVIGYPTSRAVLGSWAQAWLLVLNRFKNLAHVA